MEGIHRYGHVAFPQGQSRRHFPRCQALVKAMKLLAQRQLFFRVQLFTQGLIRKAGAEGGRHLGGEAEKGIGQSLVHPAALKYRRDLLRSLVQDLPLVLGGRGRIGQARQQHPHGAHARTRRVAAISLKEGDRLLGVDPAREDSILLITSQGMSIRFARDTVPEMGRVAAGVKGIRLEAGDQVVFAQQVGEDGEVLTISDRGYAKRSFVFDHELQGRNGKGLKAFDFKKNGSNGTAIAAALYVREPYNFTVEQKHGAVTLCNTEEVRIDNRAGRGDLLVMALLDDVVIGARRQR